MKRKIVIMAGGGTGGHIYPALAIAKSIQLKNTDVDVHFVGSENGLESQIIPKEGFPIHLLPVGKLNYQGNIFGKIKTLIQIPRALWKCLFLLWELKPMYVFGVGGYASGPVVLMASILGFKVAIWEPNAHPGLTNRWLSRFVRKSYIIFSDAKKYLSSKQIISAGYPVRAEIEELTTKEAVSVQNKKFKILVFGGSQGSMRINEVVSELICSNPVELQDVIWIHQTGSLHFQKIKNNYLNISNVEVKEYIHNMPKYYQEADLVICRSGAGTLAELAASGKASILIPLPSAADNHQVKNAENLVRQKAAKLILQNDLTKESLLRYIFELKSNSEERLLLSQNIRNFHYPKAAQFLADEIMQTAAL